MKRTLSLLAAIALILGWAGTMQAGEPSPSTLADLGLSALPADHAPMTSANVGVPPIVSTAAVCAVGTYQYLCKVIGNGPYSGSCGSSTWKYWVCRQYKNSAGQWYYQNCDSGHEVCSPPGGAECIPCL